VIHLHVHTGHQIFPKLPAHALLFKYASQIHIKVDYCNEDEAEQAAYATQHILSAIIHHEHLRQNTKITVLLKKALGVFAGALNLKD